MYQKSLLRAWCSKSPVVLVGTTVELCERLAHHGELGLAIPLKRVGVASLRELSPALPAAFIVDSAPTLSRTSRLHICSDVRTFLRFCHRERIIEKDLSAAVEMPQIYRLADVPRSITWDEVRRMLETIDRRAAHGRRDYAILLLLVTYGLRANEVVKLTLDDIDWKYERLNAQGGKPGTRRLTHLPV